MHCLPGGSLTGCSCALHSADHLVTHCLHATAISHKAAPQVDKYPRYVHIEVSITPGLADIALFLVRSEVNLENSDHQLLASVKIILQLLCQGVGIAGALGQGEVIPAVAMLVHQGHLSHPNSVDCCCALPTPMP